MSHSGPRSPNRGSASTASFPSPSSALIAKSGGSHPRAAASSSASSRQQRQQQSRKGGIDDAGSRHGASTRDANCDSAGVQSNLFDIDFVGTGNFRASQVDLRLRRTVDLARSPAALLSSRGLQHRLGRGAFAKDVRAASAVIEQISHSRRGVMNGKQESPQLFGAYFQRALGNERLGHIDRAIEDYNTCVRIDSTASAAYFNRSSLYYASERYEEALQDLDKAISLNPSNREYRLNRALVERRLGNFADAIKDTIVSRALLSNPCLFDGIENPENAPTPEGEAGLLLGPESLVDPVRACLRSAKLSRPEDHNFEEVLKFLVGLKMFRGLTVERSILCTIAQYLVLVPLEGGEVLFDEGAPADRFYIVYEGLITIFKKTRGTEKVQLQTLVEFGCGQSFGDANLEETGGVRTAGAMAKKRSLLLSMTAEEFRAVMGDLRRMMRAEVRKSMLESKVFKSWSPDNIEKLASKSVRLSFNAGKTIINAGDVAKHLYLIFRGVVKITKPVLRSKLMEDSEFPEQLLGAIGHSGFDAPGADAQPGAEGAQAVPGESTGLWVRDLSWQSRLDMDDNEFSNGDFKDSKNLVDCNVCVLGSGQIFGELSVLGPGRCTPYSAAAFTDVDLYQIDASTVCSLGAKFNPACMAALTEAFNVHSPAGDKIAHYFRSKLAWQRQKEDILRTIRIDQPNLLPPLPNHT